MKKGEEFLEWRRYNMSLRGVQDLSPEKILASKELEYYNRGFETDWLDEITQFAPINNYLISVSGMTKRSNYYLSAGYLDQKGVIDGDDYQSFNLTSKLENKITDWLSVGVSLYLNTQDYTGFAASVNRATWYTPFSYRWVEGSEGKIQQFSPTPSLHLNPYENFYNDDLDKRWSLRGIGSITAKIPWIEGLSFTTKFSPNHRVTNQGFFGHELSFVDTDIPSQLNNPDQFLNRTGGWKRTNTFRSWVSDNLLNYNNSFGDHRINAVIGYTRDYGRSERVQFNGSDFAGAGTSVLGFYGLHLAHPEKKNGSSTVGERANVAYLGRLAYSYKYKYLLTAIFRRDGYSAFAPGFKFGNFPSISVAWTASEEDFIRKIIPNFDFLKLRLSYGKNGNQGIGSYSTLAGVGTGVTVFGDQTFNITAPSSLGNEALTWETTTSLNFGINFALLNNRLSGDIDFYKSETTDQLLTRNLPTITGYGSVRTNIGQLDNKGFEVSLNTVNIRSPKFEWKTGFTFWYNRDKLISLVGLDANGDGIEDDDIGNRWFIGKSLSSVYDFTVDGIVQTDDTEYIDTYGASPGDLKIIDINGRDDDGNLTGQPDGKINADDRSIIGNSGPKYRAYISNTLSYKNFQLFFDVNIITGGGNNNYYIAGNSPAFRGFGGNNHVANWLAGREFWRPDNPSNVVPRPDYGNPFGYGFYQKRSFVRLQNVTLSYQIDKHLKDSWKINNLKVFITGKNLGLITDWIGSDPENAGRLGSNPVLRTFTTGFNFSF